MTVNIDIDLQDQLSARADFAHHHAVALMQYVQYVKRCRAAVKAKKKRAPRAPTVKPVKTPTGRPGYGTYTAGILRYLEEHGPATGVEIAEANGWNKANTRYRCKGLYADGRLVHIGESRGNQPAVFGIAPANNREQQS